MKSNNNNNKKSKPAKGGGGWVIEESPKIQDKVKVSVEPTKTKDEFINGLNEDEIDNDDFYEDDKDSKQNHSMLIKNLVKDSSQNKHQWESKRSEACDDQNEYQLSKSKETRLGLGDLMKLSSNKVAKKSLRQFESKKILPLPLKKPIAEKVSRKVNFREVSEHISRYDPIVKEIRNADQLVFPIDDEKVLFKVDKQLESNSNVSEKKFISAIEKEIYKEIAENEDNIETNDRALTENELSILKAKNIDEARQLHKEIQRRRQLISYQEAKFRRMRKIKSKNYHRIKNRQNLRKTVEDFEKLIATDSGKAMEKLDELDRLRALERATLKHRNTGKWAKHNKLRAKYDDQARQDLNVQLKMSGELMKKRSIALLNSEDNEVDEDDSDDDEDNGGQVMTTKPNEEFNKPQDNLEQIQIPDNYNPWISTTIRPKKKKISVEITAKPETLTADDSIKDSTKFFTERINQRMKDAKSSEIEELLRNDEADEKILNEGGLNDFANHEQDDSVIGVTSKKHKKNPDSNDNNNNESELNLNPDNLISNLNDIKNPGKLVSEIDVDENETGGGGGGHSDNESDDGQAFDELNFHSTEMQKYLREAFADDDVVQDFIKEQKAKEEQESKPIVSSYMPGWGSWAGNGIRENRRKRSRVIRQQNNAEKRISRKVCNAIFSPLADDIGSNLKIKFRPANIANVGNFELKCLKPIGSNWNPETIHRTMTEPKIITKMGTMIEPMESKMIETK